MSKGWENVKPSPVEKFHALLQEEFHKYRKKNAKNPKSLTIELNGLQFSNIVVEAKNKLYEEYPEAKKNVPK